MAIETFIIEDIQIEGLQRVSAGAVFVALPVRAGDEMNDVLSAASIEAVYATGLFDDVQLRRAGDDLIVSVVERPLIAATEFQGNRKIKKEGLESALRVAGLNAGGIYSPELLDSFIDELKREYIRVGYFSVTVETSVVPVERNRVELFFKIYEGKVALIRDIRIVGNEQYSDEEIIDLMKITTKKSFGLFNRNNRYNSEVIRADVESLISFYNNQGYINFAVESLNSFISDDRRDILIVLVISEGDQYQFGEISVTSTDEVIGQEELDTLVSEATGEPYSFDAVSQTRSNITSEHANLGYARTQVDPLPTVDDETQSIDVNYVVDPGKITYVRRILIHGNYNTDDSVIRRELRIHEGGVYSSEEIAQSRGRLGRLGLFQSIDIQVVDVANVDDQVDIFVEVTESLTGSLLFGVGYSDAEKASFNVQFSQRNLYGTGKQFTVDLGYSDIYKSVEFDFLNPYYTLDGISRGFNLEYAKTDTAESDTRSIYNFDTVAGGMRYGFPVSEVSVVGIEMSAAEYKFATGRVGRGDFFVEDFIKKQPKSTTGSVTLSYRRDTRDRSVFASSGSDTYGAVEFTGGKFSHYVLRGRHDHYFALADSTTLRLASQVDYGSGELPFFKNFYMLGATQIRGYESDSLGVRETCVGRDKEGKIISDNTGSPGPCAVARSLGGNLRIFARADLYLPFLGTRDTDDRRFSLFVDAGNTFMTSNSDYAKARKKLTNKKVYPNSTVKSLEKVSLDNLRATSGLAFEWLSPVGPFGISYAVPIKEKKGDQLDKFQITLGYLN